MVLYSFFICTVPLSTILGLERVPGWGLEIASLLTQILVPIILLVVGLHILEYLLLHTVIRKPPQMLALRSVRRSFSTD
ncbi:uncharacterized protein FFC1_06975 [Fusarium fujikuroi]|nr:uncharacterized protein FFC1_06975 [Fusarium fujikuroi]